MSKTKKFEIYRIETFSHKKQDSNGFTKERKRLFKHKPSKRQYELISKRRGKTYLYTINEEANLDGEILKLFVTQGELICKNNSEYLNQIVKIIGNIIYQTKRKQKEEKING